MTKLFAYKYRIYPNKEQEKVLNQTFGCVRFVWNQMVSRFNSYSVMGPNLPDLNEKELKEQYDWLNESSAAALQQKRIDFQSFKKQYFNKKRKKKLGRPNFKSKRGRQSYRLDGKRFKLDCDRIRIEKIGFVKIKIDRMYQGKARNITISKTPTNEFYVSILVEEIRTPLLKTGETLGIDLGLNDLLVLSNGKKYDNPRYYRESQAKLAKAQKHLSRKQRGSKRYERQRLKVAKIHQEVSNKRKHHLHEISSYLVKNFDVICMEDLNVAGMARSNLAKSIYDAGWTILLNQLQYKCDWYGKELIQINRFFPSSKTCSSCCTVVESLPLDIREWTCSSCGELHDRDINAAKNILAVGRSKSQE